MLRGRLLKTLLCSACLVVAAVSPALGHAELESATPAEGEELSRAPGEVRLTFGEPVEASFSPIEVYDAGGSRVDRDDARSDPNDPGTVVASLEEGLTAGSYTVRWAITSADGDPVSGEYAFSVGASSEGAATTGTGGAASSGDDPLTNTGGLGSVPLYAGLALCALVVLGLSLRGRGR